MTLQYIVFAQIPPSRKRSPRNHRGCFWNTVSKQVVTGCLASERVKKLKALILSCPPAGPTTADESLFSMVLPGGNFVFTFVLGGRPLGGRLEGWQQALLSQWRSFETRR